MVRKQNKKKSQSPVACVTFGHVYDNFFFDAVSIPCGVLACCEG
jgi:hypothetical protein